MVIVHPNPLKMLCRGTMLHQILKGPGNTDVQDEYKPSMAQRSRLLEMCVIVHGAGARACLQEAAMQAESTVFPSAHSPQITRETHWWESSWFQHLLASSPHSAPSPSIPLLRQQVFTHHSFLLPQPASGSGVTFCLIFLPCVAPPLASCGCPAGQCGMTIETEEI